MMWALDPMPQFESCLYQLLALEQQVQRPGDRCVAVCQGRAKRLTWLEGTEQRAWSCRIWSPAHPQESALTETTTGKVSPTCGRSWVRDMRAGRSSCRTSKSIVRTLTSALK